MNIAARSGGDPIQPAGRAKLRIFISYSRKDSWFADEIASGLEFHGGFEVLMDRESIHEGEDWKARLGSLILDADTIVFVLSPSSAGSPICAWEVSEAERLSKRIIPIQAAVLDGAVPPHQLAALNYVRFDPHDDGRPRSFVEGLDALCRTLNTDIGWLREHTRLLVRAQEWESSGRAENRLLFGDSVKDAKKWLDNRPKAAPPVTELHRDYIATSEKVLAERESSERNRAEQLELAVAEATRSSRIARRSLYASLVLLVASGAAGAYGWQQRQVAQAAREQLAQLFKESENARAALVLEANSTPAAEQSTSPAPAPAAASVRPSLDSLRAEYVALFRSMEIRADHREKVDWYVRKLLEPKNRSRYEAVSTETNVPWFVIGLIHAIEATYDFNTHLHNGDPLTARTRQAPAGRPPTGSPPFTWEESALDFVKWRKWDNQADWSLATTLYRLEANNGFRSRVLYKINSPYLWSFSNHYTKGKFVADNVFDGSAVSKQCGLAVILKVLVDQGIVEFAELKEAVRR